MQSCRSPVIRAFGAQTSWLLEKTERRPEPSAIDPKEGQTGISFRRLFGPYLQGAKTVTLVDPYLRFDYQIHNLMSFIELLEPENEGFALQVITAAGSDEEEVEWSEKLWLYRPDAACNETSIIFARLN